MAIRQNIKFLISASFWSIVIGLVALYYTVRGTRTSLVVDVASELNVMDVRTPLKDLSILFQGQDIQKENANLRILGIRIANEGEANILENYFDSKIPWGLRIEGGQLIEARVTGSSSNYLSENLHPRVTEKSEVTFDKVIFDKGKYVALELLVLHDKNVEPRVRPIGKIAGMDEIPVRNSFRERDQEGLAGKVFKGPIAVQIARTIAYFLFGLCIIVVVAIASDKIADIPSSLKQRSRRKQVALLPREESPEKEKKRQALVNIFVTDGVRRLKRLEAALNDPEALARATMPDYVHRVRIGDRPDLDLPAHVRGNLSDDDYITIRESSPLDPLFRAGLVRRNGITIEVDPDIGMLLSNLLKQLSDVDGGNDESAVLEKRPAKKKSE